MKVYEEQVVPATTKKVCVRRKCDLCGVESKSSDWAGAWYEVNETDVRVTVKHRVGSQFPEGSSGEEYEVDICPECFQKRLIPWLKSQGANITESTFGY